MVNQLITTKYIKPARRLMLAARSRQFVTCEFNTQLHYMKNTTATLEDYGSSLLASLWENCEVVLAEVNTDMIKCVWGYQFLQFLCYRYCFKPLQTAYSTMYFFH